MKLKQTAFLFSSAMILLSACSSEQAKFYYLSPAAPAPKGISTSAKQTILLSPVQVPAYLNGPQMATQVQSNEIFLDEFHRWAEPLKNNLQQVLAADLQNALPGTHVTFGVPFQTNAPAYRIALTIQRFLIVNNQQVVLDLNWQWYRGNAQLIGSYSGHYERPIQPQDKNDAVRQLSALLNDAARDMARKLS